MGTKVSSGSNKNGARPWAHRRTQFHSRHDNNSSKEKIESSLHQPNDAEARTSSQRAEEQHRSGEEPISGPAVVPLTDDAESRGRPGEDARWGRPSRLLVQQRESRRPREETRTRNWEKTHFYGFGGNEAEGGKEGGESFNMSHFGRVGELA